MSKSNLQFYLEAGVSKTSILLLIINIAWILLAMVSAGIAITLVKEDFVVQWLQFAFLIVAAVYCFKAAFACKEMPYSTFIKTIFLLCAVTTLFLAFEEISWGQRVFGVKTPDVVLGMNVQGELTIHNLYFFQRFRHWLIIIFGLIGLSLLLVEKTNLKLLQPLKFFVPSKDLIVGFALILFSGLVLEAGYIAVSLTESEIAGTLRFWGGRYSEIGEFGVSLVAFAYAYNKFKVIKNTV